MIPCDYCYNVNMMSLDIKFIYTPALDGEQRLVFYHINLFDAVKRLLALPSFLGQQHVAFEPQVSKTGKRVFCNVNGSLWWEELCSRYPELRMVGIILNSDGSFFGVHKDGHPIYSE